MLTFPNGSNHVEMSTLMRRNSPPDASNENEEAGDPARTGETLAEIVSACQNGDEEARHQLYESCHRSVFRFVARIVGMDEAADVSQEVFLQAFRAIRQFDGRAQFTTWLYRLAVNQSLQYLRRKKRWQHQDLDWEPMDHSPDRDNMERKDLLEQALARLDPELRAIFLLREVEGQPYQEIAKALEIPEGTVGSRLNRARRELKQHLSDLGYEL